MNEYELYHHGIKGMKWGVRKKYGAATKGIVSNKPKGRQPDWAPKKTDRQKRWEDDHGINPNRPNGTSRNKPPITDLKTLRARNKQAGRVVKAGWGMKLASVALNSIGQKAYNSCKDGATSAGVATIRGLGYSAKILNKLGSAAIVGGKIQQYQNYREWANS